MNDSFYSLINPLVEIKPKTLGKNGSSAKTLQNLQNIYELIQHLIKLLEEIRGNEEPEEDLVKEGLDFYEIIKFYKIKLIKEALKKSRGRQNQAAKLLNLNRSTLNAIIKKYDIYI